MAAPTVKQAIDLLRANGFGATPQELLTLGRQLAAYAKEEARMPALAPLGDKPAGIETT